MQYNAKDRAVIRFDRDPQPWSEAWSWLLTGLFLFALVLWQYGPTPLTSGSINKDTDLILFIIGMGSCLLIIHLIARGLARGDYLNTLELIADDTLRWSTRRKKKEFPLRDIRLLKLYTTKHSPAWAPIPEARRSGSLHHRCGVIFIDNLSIAEFRQLEEFFQAIVHASPEVKLVNDITPYDPSIETNIPGPGE